MRQVFTIVVVAVFVAAGVGCGGKAANVEEANTTNTVTESQFANITDANVALAEGDRLLDENQTEQAIQALKQAVKLNPDLPEPHFKLGIAYALLELQYTQSGTVDPDNPDVKVKSRSQKAFEKAVETYKKWLTAHPNDDTAHFNLARTYYKLDKIDEAEKEFKQAVKIKPDDADYQTELGGLLIKLAEYRDAITALKKAVELDATNERAASLLEDAEAGQKRLDYVSPKNDANKTVSNRAANANANVSLDPESNSNSAPRTPPANTVKTKKGEPANKPKPKKDEAVDKRPRVAPAGRNPN